MDGDSALAPEPVHRDWAVRTAEGAVQNDPVRRPEGSWGTGNHRGLAHAQAETAGEGAVREAHGGVVLASIGSLGWAQPQREVPALEAALIQLHAGRQGQPPAAQASWSHAQDRVAAGCWAPGRRDPLAKVKVRGGSMLTTVWLMLPSDPSSSQKAGIPVGEFGAAGKMDRSSLLGPHHRDLVPRP